MFEIVSLYEISFGNQLISLKVRHVWVIEQKDACYHSYSWFKMVAIV